MAAENAHGDPMLAGWLAKPSARGNPHWAQGVERRVPHVDFSPTNLRVVRSGPTHSVELQPSVARRTNGPKRKGSLSADSSSSAFPINNFELRRESPEVILISDDEGDDNQTISVNNPLQRPTNLSEHAKRYHAVLNQEHTARQLAGVDFSSQNNHIMNPSYPNLQFNSPVPVGAGDLTSLSFLSENARFVDRKSGQAQQIVNTSSSHNSEHLYPGCSGLSPKPIVRSETGIGCSIGNTCAAWPTITNIRHDIVGQEMKLETPETAAIRTDAVVRSSPSAPANLPVESRPSAPRIVRSPILSSWSGWRSAPGSPYPGLEARLETRHEREPSSSSTIPKENGSFDGTTLASPTTGEVWQPQSTQGDFLVASLRFSPSLRASPLSRTSSNSSQEQVSQVGALLPFFSSRSYATSTERQCVETGLVLAPTTKARAAKSETLTPKQKALRFRASLAAFSRKSRLDQLGRSGRPVLSLFAKPRKPRFQMVSVVHEGTERRPQENVAGDVIEILDSGDEEEERQARRPGSPRGYDKRVLPDNGVPWDQDESEQSRNFITIQDS